GSPGERRGVIMDEMSDFDRAHMEFLRQRMTEVDAGCRQAMGEFGEAFGVESLTPEDVTPQLYERMIRAVVAQIRHWGNADLADRYQSAHEHAWRALKDQGRCLRVRQERDWTDVERVQADAAEVAADEATEHFERVQAEASAFFK